MHFASFKFRLQNNKNLLAQQVLEISSLITANCFNCSACHCCCRWALLTFPKRNPRSSSRKIMRNMQKMKQCHKQQKHKQQQQHFVRQFISQWRSRRVQVGAHAPHKEWQQRVAEWKMVPLTLIAGPFLALATKDRFETDSGCEGGGRTSVHCCFERS